MGVTNEVGILIWPGVAAFCLTMALTPVFRRMFHFWNILDAPDAARRIHSAPIPRVGGMVVGSALVIAFILTCSISPSSFTQKQLDLVWKIAPSAAVVFGTGVLDDLFGLSAWQKLLGQLVAAGIACSSGILMTGGWWVVPVSILWLLGCTNGFNLIDGLDGLAGGAGCIGAITIGIVALIQGSVPLAVVVLALAGGLLGFLRYNFHPATVFLGDSGSLLLGFVLGCAGIMWSRMVVNQASLLAPALVFSVPLLDVALSIVRRAIGRRPIFSPDLDHIHHRMLGRSTTTSQAAFRLHAMCGIAAIFGVLESITADGEKRGFILFLYALVVLAGIRYLGFFRSGSPGPVTKSGSSMKPESPVGTELKSFSILGVNLNLLNIEEAETLIEHRLRSRFKTVVSLVNPHSAIVAQHNAEFMGAINSSTLALPDGVGIVLAFRALGLGSYERVAGTDLMCRLCADGRSRGLRHYFYGGAPGVAELLKTRLTQQFGGLIVAGAVSPPFRDSPDATDAEIAAINESQPDVLWVGLGAPKQEVWIARHRSRIEAPVIIGVGAAFDFLSGRIRRAPAWAQNSGLEWLYRLLNEPRRMWRRNLNSPKFVWAVAREQAMSRLRKPAGVEAVRPTK